MVLLLAVLTQQQSNNKQSKFNDALGSFMKKINGTKFPKNKTIDKSKCPSNMRKTTEFAKQIHDIFTFVSEYSDDQTISKRALSADLTISSTYCPYQNQKISCSSSTKYRSYDGTCNNLNNPFLGASNTPYTRLLSPAYRDGTNLPRTLGLSGKSLPNPRSLSLAISLPSSVQRLAKNSLSQLYATFGQFLAHNILGTSASTGNQLCLS